jgi:hypothetical protein
MITADIERFYRPAIRTSVVDGGMYGRSITTEYYGCGCSADNVRGEDVWTVIFGPTCLMPTHRL